MYLRVVFFTVFHGFLVGCASMAGTFTDTFGTGPKVYIGARSDAGTAMNTAPCWTGKKRGEGCLVMLLTPLCVIDLVPSLEL